MLFIDVSIRSIIRNIAEGAFDAKKYIEGTPPRYLYHTSNPIHRDRISKQGLIPYSTKEENEGLYLYEDEYAYGYISINNNGVGIFEWNSKNQEKGGTKKSLQNLKHLYGHVDVIDIGEEGSNSYSYWQHMKELGLVDKLLDEENIELKSEGYDDLSPDMLASLRKIDWYEPQASDKKVVGNNTYLHFPADKNNPYESDWVLWGRIRAFDNSDGSEVGNATYGKMKEYSPMNGSIDVRPDKRRQGIGSEMYKWAEELTGETIEPDTPHTKSAEKFWADPKREFGNKANETLIKEDMVNISSLPDNIVFLDVEQTRHDYGNRAYSLYDIDKDKIIASLSPSKEKVNDNHKYVSIVAAEKGYGPTIYEIAMMDLYPMGLTPYIYGDIDPKALNVWKRFYGRDDIEKEPRESFYDLDNNSKVHFEKLIYRKKPTKEFLELKKRSAEYQMDKLSSKDDNQGMYDRSQNFFVAKYADRDK